MIGGRKVTKEIEDAFLNVLKNTGNVTKSARAVGCSKRQMYYRKNEYKEFGERWEEAIEEAGEMLEGEARRRAEEGYLEPVFYRGKSVGEVRRYSDSLMALLLKAHHPKFKDMDKQKEVVAKIEVCTGIEGGMNGGAAEDE